MKYRVLFLHHPYANVDKTLQHINPSDFLIQRSEIDKFKLAEQLNRQAAIIIIQVLAKDSCSALCEALREYLPDALFILILDEYHADTVKEFFETTTGYYLLENQLELLPTILAKRLEQQLASLNRELLIQIQHQTIFTLAIRPAVVRGDWKAALREITRISSKAIEISRVGVWLYNKEQDIITCEMLYDLNTQQYQSGEQFRASDYPVYFEALKHSRVIIASNASEHPATSEFGESYLISNDIKSMLDAPIWLRGEMIGVVCHEQTGKIREWSLEDQYFAAAMGSLVSHTIENREHYQMEAALHQSHQDTREFLEQLKTLHEVSLTLASAADVDELCQKAILLGREQLGFVRLGIWFVDENFSERMQGSFGTAENGQLRDERGFNKLTAGVYQEMLEEKVALRVWENAPHYNHLGEVVGKGWWAVATLWDGHRVIGWIIADNYHSYSQASQQQGEILKLYGLTLGHLCTQKRIQSALQQSENYLKQAESIAHLGNFSFNIITQELLWSDETYHIFGVPPGTEISLERYQSLLAPEDYERVMSWVERAVSSRQSYELEHDIVLDDGTRKHLFARALPIVDDNGDVVKIFGIVQDISERIYAAQQRIELKLNKEKLLFLRDFVEHMTHDLKTPLATLKATTYVLQRIQDPLKQQEQLHRLDEQVNQLESMIDDILTVARLDHMPQITFTDIQLNQLIEDAIQQLQTKALQKDIRFQLELAEDLPRMTSAPNELSRALLNLIENALNYTAKGGTITLRTYTNKSQIVCEVEDTGIGIDTSDLSRIFEQFYRADNARSFERGTGLGLVIVNKIVQLHRGEIRVDSVLGKGTKFTLEFEGLQNL